MFIFELYAVTALALSFVGDARQRKLASYDMFGVWTRTTLNFDSFTTQECFSLPNSPEGTEKSAGSTVNFCTFCALEMAFLLARPMPSSIALCT